MQKVLIVCYYWPPAGGPGVQRWLKFVKYLPEFGMEPIVFVPNNPNYPITDEALLDEIPDGTRVLRQPIFEPYGLASLFSKKKTKRISSGLIQKRQKQSLLERLLLWIRGNLFIPDARKYWIRPSVRSISRLLQEEEIKTLITTGPPHSVHLIGLRLSTKFSLQWIADFRDPWTTIGYHKKLKLTKAAAQKHKKWEHKVVNAADHLIVTSTTTKAEFAQLTPKPITVVTNGYDGGRPVVELDKNFTISHIGSLLTDRNPMVLWEVLQELCTENDSFKKALNIQLVGVVGEVVKDSLEQHGLMDRTTDFGYVPHSRVTALQAASQLLLLLEIDSGETKGIVPGKLFEYLNAKRPILALGPEGWEAGSMVVAHKAGYSFTVGDRSRLKSVLLEGFHKFQNGKLECESVDIERYSRRELTQQLAKTIAWESS